MAGTATTLNDSVPVDDDDDEYEETLVMVELSGIVDTDYFSRVETPNCRIWGLDGSQPILQLDRYFFVGGYEDVVGTALFFDETDKKDESAADAGDSPTKTPKDIFTTFTSDAYQKTANLLTRSHADSRAPPSGLGGTSALDIKQLKMYGHTFKKLSMHRAFLNKKRADTTEGDEPEDEETDVDNVVVEADGGKVDDDDDDVVERELDDPGQSSSS